MVKMGRSNRFPGKFCLVRRGSPAGMRERVCMRGRSNRLTGAMTFQRPWSDGTRYRLVIGLCAGILPVQFSTLDSVLNSIRMPAAVVAPQSRRTHSAKALSWPCR
jgi:hypothetical protein